MGSNMFFAQPGAVLDVVETSVDERLIHSWETRLQRACVRLRWPTIKTVARRHAGGMLLAFSAPIDQLLLATEVNEWALCASLSEHDPARRQALQRALADTDGLSGGDPPLLDETAAMERFERLSALESQPRLRALLDAASARELQYVLDETTLTLGAGVGGSDFALPDLPDVAAVNWSLLRDIPTALVTGSNGKTTTVRLLAACARRHGWLTAYNCTDGVYLNDEPLAKGDYAGPAGARLVMRNQRAQAAIIEAARGGILRRGIAVARAHAAVVTNVSCDHFGEYGIDDLSALADVKLSVAAAVIPTGLLILNIDDVRLRAQVDALARRSIRPPLGWFSADPNSPALKQVRSRYEPTCGPRSGRLWLYHAGVDHDLGAIDSLPLSMGGVATYNIANMAGAALAAVTLGIAPATIAAVLATFGSKLSDNPGRMMRFDVRGVTVLVDYAHNPDGLHGFLDVANRLRGNGRLGVLLGQAGNRSDADIQELARVAVESRPDLIVVKENSWQLRGREPGEVSRVLRAALTRLNYPDAAVAQANGEIEATQHALAWARPGDILALPLHSSVARAEVLEILQSL